MIDKKIIKNNDALFLYNINIEYTNLLEKKINKSKNKIEKKILNYKIKKNKELFNKI